MDEQKLCGECWEYLKKKYGDQAYNPPWQHCHHPEKPPCEWCKRWRELKLAWHGTPFWYSLNYLINFNSLDKKIEQCPVCGAKIG